MQRPVPLAAKSDTRGATMGNANGGSSKANSEIGSPASTSNKKFQFVHENAYGLLGAKPKGSLTRAKWSVEEVIKEAIRSPGSCQHVRHPKPAVCHAGLASEELLLWVKKTLEPAVKTQQVSLANGRKRRQRIDTPVVIVGVASYPRAASQFDSNYKEWIFFVLCWLKRRYKDLVSVLEHVDEGYGHLHFFAWDAGRPVRSIRACGAREMEAKAKGLSPKQIQSEIRTGFKEYQDDFFRAVGKQCGLARISDSPQPRMSRSKWKAKKEEAELNEKLTNSEILSAARMAYLAKQRSNETENMRRTALMELESAALALEQEAHRLALLEIQLARAANALTDEQARQSVNELLPRPKS